MKLNGRKTQSVLLTAFLMILCFCTMVYAGPRQGMKQGPGHMGPMESMEPRAGQLPVWDLLSKAIQENMTVEVIADLTGNTIEDVESELAETHMMAFLENYEIDPETFKAAMDEKLIEVTENASACGLITETQASEIIEQVLASDTAEDEETEE